MQDFRPLLHIWYHYSNMSVGVLGYAFCYYFDLCVEDWFDEMKRYVSRNIGILGKPFLQTHIPQKFSGTFRMFLEDSESEELVTY